MIPNHFPSTKQFLNAPATHFKDEEIMKTGHDVIVKSYLDADLFLAMEALRTKRHASQSGLIRDLLIREIELDSKPCLIPALSRHVDHSRSSINRNSPRVVRKRAQELPARSRPPIAFHTRQ